MTLTMINRTLDQELAALARGASLECLVCGEFAMRFVGPDERLSAIACPECRSLIAEGVELPEIDLPSVERAV